MSLWALFVEEKYAGTSTNSFFNLTFCLLKKFVELWATSSYCFWLAHSVNFNVIIEDDWATQGFNYLILKNLCNIMVQMQRAKFWNFLDQQEYPFAGRTHSASFFWLSCVFYIPFLNFLVSLPEAGK